MTKVLVVYGSRHGATEGIAQRIGEVLRAQGLAAVVVSADKVADEDVRAADGFVVGSAVYLGRWLKEPTEFLENHPSLLRARPVWLFSSGPLPGSTASKDPIDPLTDALGPEAGPGSGGRKKIEELATSIGAREHRVFFGRYDPDAPPRSFPNVSSGCCRWRKGCSRTATSGTGRYRGMGQARSLRRWRRRPCRSDLRRSRSASRPDAVSGG